MFVKYVCKNNNSSSRLTFNEKELKIILIFQVVRESALIISSSWKNFKKGRSVKRERGKSKFHCFKDSIKIFNLILFKFFFVLKT